MLTTKQVSQARNLFKEQLAPQFHSNITFTSKSIPGASGYIQVTTQGTTKYCVGVKIVNVQRDRQVLYDGFHIEKHNVLKTVLHEFTHVLQTKHGDMNSHSYAYNEIVAETTSCFVLGLQYKQLNSPEYVHNYMNGAYCNPGQELMNDETTEEMVQSIAHYIALVKTYASKHGLL